MKHQVLHGRKYENVKKISQCLLEIFKKASVEIIKAQKNEN